jgi:phosphatidylglycerol:prolipoprotein diacylglycerol transferase
MFVFLELFWNTDPVMLSIGSFELRYYTLGFLLAFVLGYRILTGVFDKDGLKREQLDSFTMHVLLGTILGARFGHCLFYEFEYYKTRPLEMILPFRFLPEGGITFTGFQGLASHGAVIGILLAVFLFSRKNKLNMLWVLDRLVIVVALGGTFIRLGNFFNSEILGKASNLPWAVVFKREDEVPRHPTQIYEAISYFAIFILLWLMYKKGIRDAAKGILFGWFLILIFGFRIFWEFFKENQEDFEAGMLMNMGQLLSIPLVLAGMYFVLKTVVNKK